MSKLKLFVPGMLAAFVLVAGCASEKKTTAADSATKSVNANCPMSGKPVSGANTVSYKGQTVGFCCGNCPNSWAKLSDSEKDAKLAAATGKK
jgi:hypothetical protein